MLATFSFSTSLKIRKSMALVSVTIASDAESIFKCLRFLNLTYLYIPRVEYNQNHQITFFHKTSLKHICYKHNKHTKRKIKKQKR